MGCYTQTNCTGNCKIALLVVEGGYVAGGRMVFFVRWSCFSWWSILIGRNRARPSFLARLGCRLGHLRLALGLLHRFDDTDGHRLSHVTDSETAQRRVLLEGLHAHGL